MPLISPRSFQTDTGALSRLVAQAQSFVLREQDVRSALAQQSRVNIQNERRLRLAEQGQITGNINRIFDVQREDEQQDFENDIRTRQLENQTANTKSLIGARTRKDLREQDLLESQQRLLDGDFGIPSEPAQRDPTIPAEGPFTGTGFQGVPGAISPVSRGIPAAQQGGPTGALFPGGQNLDQFAFSEGTIRRPRNQEEVQLNNDEKARLVAQRSLLVGQRVPDFKTTRGIPSEIVQGVFQRQRIFNEPIDKQIAQIDTWIQNLKGILPPEAQTAIRPRSDIIAAETAIETAKARGETVLEEVFGVPDVPISVAEEMLNKAKGIATPVKKTPPALDPNGTPTMRQTLSILRGKQRPGR